MVSTDEDAHLNELGAVPGQAPFPPEQGDDIAHSVIFLDDCGHGHAGVGGFLASVVADGGHDVRGRSHFPVLDGHIQIFGDLRRRS